MREEHRVSSNSACYSRATRGVTECVSAVATLRFSSVSNAIRRVYSGFRVTVRVAGKVLLGHRADRSGEARHGGNGILRAVCMASPHGRPPCVTDLTFLSAKVDTSA